jgi:multidrug efflux pump subunit AcrA (membrane-fusion protein)
MNSNSPSSPSAPPPVSLRRIAEIVVVLIVIGLVIGLVPRWRARHRLLAETRTDSVVTVNVISPTPSKSDLGTPLPAEVQAFVQATIHARASGYLKNWFVDIGDHVTNGQALAEIDTPELDQQLAQAKAEAGSGPGRAGSGQNHRRPLDGTAQDRQCERTGNRRKKGRPGFETGERRGGAGQFAAPGKFEKL